MAGGCRLTKPERKVSIFYDDREYSARWDVGGVKTTAMLKKAKHEIP